MSILLRLGTSLVTLLGVVSVTFLLTFVVPADPARTIAGQARNESVADPENAMHPRISPAHHRRFGRFHRDDSNIRVHLPESFADADQRAPCSHARHKGIHVRSMGFDLFENLLRARDGEEVLQIVIEAWRRIVNLKPEQQYAAISKLMFYYNTLNNSKK